MSVLILERLKSRPEFFRSGEPALLHLLLLSQDANGEQATVGTGSIPVTMWSSPKTAKR